ncbi:hypothetical protein U9M48_017779 [Paspalum notatum var. saurae]|uniref:UDP-glycosyltransferases domain-containing protein n=1 Tax=Paspalum notatum var. saurae TaxID=547442 RepID=A0AAQ3T8I3_PASNO
MSIEKQMKTTVVLYPSLGAGHLNPMVELAKVFLRRSVSVIVAVVDSPDAMGRLAIAKTTPSRPVFPATKRAPHGARTSTPRTKEEEEEEEAPQSQIRVSTRFTGAGISLAARAANTAKWWSKSRSGWGGGRRNRKRQFQVSAAPLDRQRQHEGRVMARWGGPGGRAQGVAMGEVEGRQGGKGLGAGDGDGETGPSWGRTGVMERRGGTVPEWSGARRGAASLRRCGAGRRRRTRAWRRLLWIGGRPARQEATSIEKQMKTTVVLYPSLGAGHLNPMVELAKVFLRRGVSVIVAVVDSPDAMGRLAIANPDIAFQHLPVPPTGKDDKYSHPIMRTIDVLRAANPALRSFLLELPAPVDALVVDMFCTDAIDVAAELDIPAYFFFTSALADLAIMLHLPYNFPRTASLKDMPEAVLHFPGVPPIRAMDMATTMQDRESDIARARLHQCPRMPEARGFLVNSFDWLEARALEALRRGLCTPGRSTPPVYCIGPLVQPGNTNTGRSWERHACLEWLDTQPNRSVVFLSFGSMGTFSAAQLRETARGLENSGHRFLWVVRYPPEHQQSKSMEPEDLEALVPDGFLERTRERGLVVRNWAPQMEVLRHDAVGAFVTHCGWNSALEAIVSGVPMICWPLYSEQRMNKVHLVEEMRLGVVVEGYEKELVKADQVEAKVRLVMESDEGKKLRERIVMAKEMAADALKEGGSSDVAFGEFLKGLKKKSSAELKT